MYAGKDYASDTEEYYRLKIYMENRLKIARHNEKYAKSQVSYKLAMNEFGDLVSVHSYLGRVLHKKWRSLSLVCCTAMLTLKAEQILKRAPWIILKFRITLPETKMKCIAPYWVTVVVVTHNLQKCC